MKKSNQVPDLRKALKTGNLQSIQQARTECFSFFGEKGPFTGYDFLPDGTLSDEGFKEFDKTHPDEMYDENDPLDKKILTLKRKIREAL